VLFDFSHNQHLSSHITKSSFHIPIFIVTEVCEHLLGTLIIILVWLFLSSSLNYRHWLIKKKLVIINSSAFLSPSGKGSRDPHQRLCLLPDLSPLTSLWADRGINICLLQVLVSPTGETEPSPRPTPQSKRLH